jgi:hypothetical protein
MFTDESKVRLSNGNLSDFQTNATQGLNEVLQQQSWHEWQRLTGVPEDFLDDLSVNGTPNTGQPVYNLNNIYRIKIPK